MNDYIREFLIGFGISFIFSLPPGMISLNVMQTTMQQGIKSAFWLALAAVLVEAAQAFIGVQFSEWINTRPSIQTGLELFVIPVFIVMGIMNIVAGLKSRKHNQKDDHQPRKTIGSFWKGLLVSALNPVAIPFWVVWASGMSSKNLLIFETSHILVFVLATTLGTLACLMLYALFSAFVVRKFKAIKQWMNLLIGTLFIGLALFQLINIMMK
jgi:threonine/homoserine/homoserine lactone efflux protein